MVGSRILVNKCQKGNPLLEKLQNVSWQFDDDLSVDYELGPTCGALFLSVKFHQMKKEYIHDRMRRKIEYRSKILLVLIDMPDPSFLLKEITEICLRTGFVIFLSWNYEEAAVYLETLKAFETKPVDVLMGRQMDCELEQLIDTITQVKSINRTNAISMIKKYKSLRNMMDASLEELKEIPGFGESKAIAWVNFCNTSL